MKKILFLLFVSVSTYSFAQEITGKTRTTDKYSNAIRQINDEYFKNDFTTINQIFADDGNYTINGDNYTKNQIIEGFAMHHNLYTKIKMPQNFVDTTFYDENNNNQVWSHLWGLWEATSKKSGKSTSNPVNVSFKWVEGRIVRASWVFDPTELNKEIAASQK